MIIGHKFKTNMSRYWFCAQLAVKLWNLLPQDIVVYIRSKHSWRRAWKKCKDTLVAQAVWQLPVTRNGSTCRGSIIAPWLHSDTLPKTSTIDSVGDRILRYMDISVV